MSEEENGVTYVIMLPGKLYRALKSQDAYAEASAEAVAAFDEATVLRKGRGERYRITGPAPALREIKAELVKCVEEAEQRIAPVDDLGVDLWVLRKCSQQPLVRAS